MVGKMQRRSKRRLTLTAAMVLTLLGAAMLLLNHTGMLWACRGSQHGICQGAATPVYVRIPKTGSTSVVRYLRSCRTKPNPNDPWMDPSVVYPHVSASALRLSGSWAVLRPVEERFASLLNYRWRKYQMLQELMPPGTKAAPRKDMRHLDFPPPDDKLTTLIDSMTDEDLANAKPNPEPDPKHGPNPHLNPVPHWIV